ncbi:MAG: hypothetical protein GY811_10855 [Myxococcales bacterium]|nr:hypothetical protein [Myxococcales bacterium]
MFAGLRLRLRHRAKATSELGNLPQRGLVKVVGKVRAGKTLLKAPITGRSCVFYCVDIGEWSNGSKTPLLSEQSKERFHIEDDTGSVLIDPEAAQHQLRSHRERGHSSESLNAHRALLKRHDFTMVDEYGELRSLAYQEYIIPPGASISALGAARRQADPMGTASYREMPQQTVIGGDSTEPLLLSES